jgi:hypothetical protein
VRYLVHVVLIIVGVVHLYAFVALFVIFGVVSIGAVVFSLASIFILVLLLFHLLLI